MSNTPTSFYYARGGQRLGPVSSEEFDRLVASGEIEEGTLVWNETLVEWKLLSEYRQIVARGYARCAVSNKLRPVAEMVQFGDKFVSAEHRDEFFQRIKQGLGGTGSTSADPAELHRLLDEQGYHTTAGSIISRAFEAWRAHFGFFVGVVAAATILGALAGQVPIVGLLAAILLQPHLNAGATMLIVSRLRGELAPFDSLFDPLKKQYGALVLFGLVSLAIYTPLIALAIAFAFFTVGAASLFSGDVSNFQPTGMFFGFIAAMIALGFACGVVTLRLSFAPLLIVDKAMGVGDAIKLSWKATGLRFWSLLGAGLVLGICSGLGVIALFIGILLTMPLYYIGVAQAYEDAFGARNG